MVAIEVENRSLRRAIASSKFSSGGEEGTRSLMRINDSADNNNNIVSVEGSPHLGLLGGNLSAYCT